MLLWFAAPSLCLAETPAVEIRHGKHEGRPCFIIRTGQTRWYFDRSGGGFCRLIDRDGRDWIGFRKTPLRRFPESAAAGYRGLPNLVFTGPDKGAGHPGFDRCTSLLVDEKKIRTTTKSGEWIWSWSFSEGGATFQMERSAQEIPWWFLYEGTVAGSFAPGEKYWGTDKGGPRYEAPDLNSQLVDSWKWVYLGDRSVPRILLIVQHDQDELPDTLWYLGSSKGGSVRSSDGMVVLGFGRSPGTIPRLRGSGQKFTVRLLEMKISDPEDHDRLAGIIDSGRE